MGRAGRGGDVICQLERSPAVWAPRAPDWAPRAPDWRSSSRRLGPTLINIGRVDQQSGRRGLIKGNQLTRSDQSRLSLGQSMSVSIYTLCVPSSFASRRHSDREPHSSTVFSRLSFFSLLSYVLLVGGAHSLLAPLSLALLDWQPR